MTQFYFRYGPALSEKENSRVAVGVRGDSGHMSRHENCPRCGGQGGSTHWRPEGGICFQCRGDRTIVVNYRVFTAEKLAKLVTAAEAKAERIRLKKEAEDTRRFLEFVRWSRDRKNLLGAIQDAKGNTFLADLAAKLLKNMILSDKQLEAAERVIKQAAERAAQDRDSEYVGTVKERIEFEAVVVGVYGSEGFYGHTDIVKFRDLSGNLFTWFASGYTELERGDRMSIKGTVKDHQLYRDIKQTILTRCKFEKFIVMTPDEAAQAEVVA